MAFGSAKGGQDWVDALKFLVGCILSLSLQVTGDAHTCFAFAEGGFQVNLGDGVTLVPTHYTLRNGGGKASALTAWVLEGLVLDAGGVVGAGQWVILDQVMSLACS